MKGAFQTHIIVEEGKTNSFTNTNTSFTQSIREIC